jgi:hypothetical protein
VSEGFYRVRVEEAGRADDAQSRRILVLHVYRDGIEAETIEFELSPVGARGLLDEVRWLEWKDGR